MPADPSEPSPVERGTLDRLVHEAIRRAASAGLTSLFLTEEALRRAFNDAVPREWVDFASRQGDEVRGELREVLSREIQRWLASLDPVEILNEILTKSDVRVTLELSAKPSDERTGALQVVSRPRCAGPPPDARRAPPAPRARALARR